MVRAQLSAGLRPGEVVALRPDHVNFNSGRIDVREWKGAKDRVVFVGNRLVEGLQEWMERRLESEWLFPTSEGTQVDTSHLRRSVKRYAREAGLEEVERISPHTLRHTFATKLYRSAGSIRRVVEGPWPLGPLHDDDLHAHRPRGTGGGHEGPPHKGSLHKGPLRVNPSGSSSLS
ncbi:tyrosine-type recombinase/integrase [Salinibacter ruber]|uniref:tyrosine-type recombinase/integrase n=1 Tax=Salinibacter ruber TaxID=146919 RepID=UPI00311AAD9B